MMDTVEVVTCHGVAMVHAQGQGAGDQGGQQEGLNEARGRLASFCREMVGLDFNGALDSILDEFCPPSARSNGRMKHIFEFCQSKNWVLCQ